MQLPANRDTIIIYCMHDKPVRNSCSAFLSPACISILPAGY